MRPLVAAAAFLVACKEPSPPQPVDIAPPATIATKDTAAVAAPRPGPKPERVAPAKQVPWTKPARPPSDQEQLLAGTWVANVGEYASRSMHMAERVMLSIADADKGKDLVTAVVAALERDAQLSSNCVWLELRPDFTGIRRECAVVNGNASALDQTDPVTGKKSDLGTPLEWFIDTTDKNALKIRFAADMVVPSAGPSGLRQLVFRHWTLRFAPGQTGANNRFQIVEAFPEHDYELPQRYTFEIFSGSYLK